jgi:hypothetical protein
MATDEQLAYEAGATLIAAKGLPGAVSRTPDELAEIVSLFASSDGWIDKVRLRAEGRWYERLYQGPDYDIWVISWLPGQSTGFHDHGASSGAFVVATGILEEHRPDERTCLLPYAAFSRSKIAAPVKVTFVSRHTDARMSST